MSKIDFNFCKEHLKKRLKDRKRVKRICFSYSQDNHDSLDITKKKKKKNKPHFLYNDGIKKLIDNFKKIKEEILVIDQKDKAEKKIINQKKLFIDNDKMTFNQIYERIGSMYKSYNRTNIKNQYLLQKSKIFTDYNNKGNEFSSEKINKIVKKISFNFYNAVNKTDLGKKINEEYSIETIKKYKKFFNFLRYYKRNQSEKKMNSNKLKYKNIYKNLYGSNSKSNKKQEIIDNSNYNFTETLKNSKYKNRINMDEKKNKTNINVNEVYKTKNISKNYPKFNKRAKDFRANTHKEYKNKLVKRTDTQPIQYMKDSIFSNFNNKNNLNLHTSEVSSYKNSTKNLFLKSSKNLISYNYYNMLNVNDISPKIYKHIGSTKNIKFTDILSKEPPLKTLSLLSENNSKSSIKHINYQTIPFYEITEENKKRRVKSSKVRNMPMYIAKISDFVKKYNDIKNKNQVIKLKRKENHLSAYSEIDKAFDIKEEMLMFLLKDKYINSQFPKNILSNQIKEKFF